MKKLVFYFMISIIFTNVIKSQDYECVSCRENEVDFSKFASGVGYLNVSTGMYSFAGGQRSVASGDYSFAFGRSAFARDLSTIAIGDNVNASWMYSIAIGRNLECRGTHAVAIGYDNQSLAGQTYTFGRNLIAGSSHSMVIGVGSSKKLLNPVPNSLMIGIFSDKPTFFVEESPDDGLTGRIGIGNITAPLAKLHILGDDDADRPGNASLYIQSAGNYYSTIWLGDTIHSIRTKPNANLVFNAGSHDYYFKNGNVGIGLPPDPDHTLDVNGDINFTGLLKQNGEIFETTKWTENAEGNLYFNDGKVGIGTDEPGEKLDVSGNITAQNINVTGIKLNDNNQGAGKLLQSDEQGNASWVDPPETGDDDWSFGTENNIFRMDGNVGIGINQPMYRLHVKNNGQGYAANFDNASPLGKGVLIRSAYGAEDMQLLNLISYNGTSLFNVDSEGDVGIGTQQTGTYKLAVAGAIRAEEVQIEHIDKWYDCVFEDDYQLTPLKDVEAFVKENKHLPEVPSEAEVMEQGIGVGQMNALLLKKVEELTLHLIAQEKKIEELQKALGQ